MFLEKNLRGDSCLAHDRPNVHFYCDLDFDPFVFMEQNKKTYGT